MGSANVFLLTVFSLAITVSASPQRIVGGLPTVINMYRYMVSLEYSWNLELFRHRCGGTILNERYVLSAAHCFQGHVPMQWRIRVGSSWANGNGWLYQPDTIILHPEYNANTFENDLAILRTATDFAFNYVSIGAASIASAAYDAALSDNDPLEAIGWGADEHGGSHNMQIHSVDLSVVNHAACTANFAGGVGIGVPANTLCAGWLGVGGKDQCDGDEGGPLLHNRVVVGVYSFGYGCAHASYPSVNTRVGPHVTWIQSIADNI